MAKTSKQPAAQKPHDLKKYLEDIKKISDWFEEQEEIDLEEALVKIREAGELIKLSKDRLVEVENEFKEIKTKIEVE
ncbi:MAG TPA: hypothetical protein VIJ29_03880 [Candidatus Paceibacterota bacterium]